jgi:hypothetical protein
MRPLVVAILRFSQLVEALSPPAYEAPHALIDPSAVRAAKAYLVE